MQELQLMAEADERARDYLAGIEQRPPFPEQAARGSLRAHRRSAPRCRFDGKATELDQMPYPHIMPRPLRLKTIARE